MKHSQKPKDKKTGKKRLIVILSVIILSAALIIGVGYAAMRFIIPRDAEESTAAVSSGEVVTINDSVMGDIEIQTVEGAEVNTYSADNLVTDENGIPAYYEDGKKISHLGIDLSEYQGDVDY